jgi:hypothetical protein
MAEQAGQEVKCGGCGAQYRAIPQLAGKTVECPKCHTKIPVPALKNKPKDEDDVVIRFQDDDDPTPAKAASIRSDETVAGGELDLAPDPRAPRRPPGSRDRSGGSIGGSLSGSVGGSLGGSIGGTKGGTLGGTRGGTLGGTRGGTLGGTRGGTRAGSISGSSSGSIGGRSATKSGTNVRATVKLPKTEDDSAAISDFDDVIDIDEPGHKGDGDDFHFSIPVLPTVVTHKILPWLLSVACLGWAGYLAVSNVLSMQGQPVGLSMVALGLLLYAALLVPLTLRSIESAALTAELPLPSVVWFQTFSLAALPTAGIVLGYFAGGTAPMITLGVLGLVAMSVLMAFMFRANVMQTVLTAFYGASAYLASTALCAAILIGIGLILSHVGIVTPWGSPPTTVAKTNQPAAVAPPPTTAPAAPAPAAPVVAAVPQVQTPVAAAAPPPPVVVPTGPPWLVPVEPIAAATAWPIPQPTISESIQVLTPVATAHATGGAPFVAFLEPKTTAIYDLRTGKRSGFVKAAFAPNSLILSADGKTLAGVESLESQGMFPIDGVAGAFEIWSTSDNRLIGQVPTPSVTPGAPPAAVPTPLAFAGDPAAPKLIASGTSNGITGLQEWDPGSGTLLHQWNTLPETRASIAVSNSGKFVAALANAVIRVLDTQSGDVAGELSPPAAISAAQLAQTKGIAFSPDGATIAAVVPSQGASSWGTLLEWNVAGAGQLSLALPIDLSAAAPPFDPTVAATPQPALPAPAARVPTAPDVAYLQWTPDGRMVRVGNGLFEINSGKAVDTLPAQMSGNLSGRLVGAGDKRAAYEFLPTGIGDRILLKTVDLPMTTINTAITQAIAGSPPPAAPSSTQPAAPTLASATSGGTVNAMQAWSATPQSTVPPVTVALAEQGQWDVKIKSMIPADPVLIQKQLAAQGLILAQLQSALDAAQVKYDQAAASGSDTQSDAHTLVTTLQQRLIEANAREKKLQDAATLAPVTRIVLAALDNGTPVKITTDTDVAAAFADGMHTGDRFHISGFGQVGDGVLLVKLRLAVPLSPKQ